MEGGRTRVRPILMTAIATMLALIPLAAGFNEGSIIAGRRLTRPMSVPVIRDIKPGKTVKVVLDAATKKVAKGALLNVILQQKLPDGTFKLYRQDAPDPPLVAVK